MHFSGDVAFQDLQFSLSRHAFLHAIKNGFEAYELLPNNGESLLKSLYATFQIGASRRVATASIAPKVLYVTSCERNGSEFLLGH